LAIVATDCVFCQIVSGEIAATRLREDDDTLVFPDIAPKAPTHVLVVPKKHLRDIAELGGDPSVSAAVLATIRAFTVENAITDFRTIFNTGADAGQSVFHVHAHVLAGRPMGWQPMDAPLD
jgi:histidine triad (HIT) family protein